MGVVSHSLPAAPCMILPGTLLWDHHSLPLPLLVDSGANDCFLDETLARRSHIPVEVLARPRTIHDLNGGPIAQVTPLTLVVSGYHWKVIHFFLISSATAPAVLRSPWLAHHNPKLDWSSKHCNSHCLRLALSPSPHSSAPTPDPPNLSLIPREYHDLAEVFSKQCTLSLLPRTFLPTELNDSGLLATSLISSLPPHGTQCCVLS